MVHEMHHAINLSLGNGIEIKSFGKDAAQPAIGIFVRASLPGSVRVSEINDGSGIALDPPPEGKCRASVEGK